MLSVEDNDSLKAVLLAFKAANRDLKNRIRRNTRAELNPLWRATVADYLSGRDALTHALLSKGVRVSPGNPPEAIAARSTRGIGTSKRLVPSRDYYLGEFGVNPMQRASYKRKNRKRPGVHLVRGRHVNVGKPRRRDEGRVIYPAFAEVAPRMVSLWVATVVRVYKDAAEGKETP